MAFDRIIVLDDELIIRKTLEEHLRRRRYAVAGVATIAEAERYLARDSFDLMFVDVRLPDGDGIQFLERLAQAPTRPMVVMITGHGSVEDAVACMRAGAYDYVIKPFSVSQIDVILEKAQAFRQVVKVNDYLNHAQNQKGDIIGESPAMTNLRTMIRKVAPTEATVLISGENGTGKEMVASELFEGSARASAPFIKVNCAAVSETLIESEFFGHEKGAYTGATEKREGRFELAHGGTILLDEISEISPRVQAKLLRVLQEREFERVGGNKTIKVDVRVLATTNRHLLQSVERGEFRQDLYYRLNVFPLSVPPLRDRAEDIPLLVESFLARLGRRHGVKIRGVSDAAMSMLVNYPWPGNVRELQNLIERAVILTGSGGFIEPAALGLLPPAPTSATTAVVASASAPVVTPVAGGEPTPVVPPASVAPTPSSPSKGTVTVGAPVPGSGPLLPLDEMERQHILHALDRTGGNRTQAANLLKISIRTLRNKLHQYRLEETLSVVG